MNTWNVTYKLDGNNWKHLREQVYGKSAEHVGKILADCKNGQQQLLVINTLNTMTIRLSGTGDRGWGEWGGNIWNTLRQSVDRYGENARVLSEKQTDIICQDLEDRWNLEAAWQAVDKS